jgi:hypothetical protein
MSVGPRLEKVTISPSIQPTISVGMGKGTLPLSGIVLKYIVNKKTPGFKEI